MLLDEIKITREIGVNSFPNVLVEKDNVIHPIKLNYIDVDEMLESIARCVDPCDDGLD